MPARKKSTKKQPIKHNLPAWLEYLPTKKVEPETVPEVPEHEITKQEMLEFAEREGFIYEEE
jgi:hypothetical protein